MSQRDSLPARAQGVAPARPDTALRARPKSVRNVDALGRCRILALMLVALRLLWRLGNVLPRLVAALPDWQKVVARFVRLCFCGLMLALPLTGGLMSSATGIPVSVLGLFTLPDLVPYDDRLHGGA